jgi:hypothetical protein
VQKEQKSGAGGGNSENIFAPARAHESCGFRVTLKTDGWGTTGNLGDPWGSLGNLFRKQGAQKWRDRTAYLACSLGVVLKIKDLEMAPQVRRKNET